LEQEWQAIRANDVKRLQHNERLKQTGRKLGQARKQFRTAQIQWRSEQQHAAARLAEERTRLTAEGQQLAFLAQQLPELDLRAQAAAERLVQSRQELRDHLAGLHSYAEQ